MNDDQNFQDNEDKAEETSLKNEDLEDELSQKLKMAQQEAEAKEGEEVLDEGQDEATSEIEALKAALARTMADLQNYKRRSEQERSTFVKMANAELLKMLLPVFDNLGRSVQHLPEDLKENEWAKGVIHINADLLKTLETLGIATMKTVGEKLDPQKHEALMSGPGEKDLVVEEFEPGYLMNGEVLKPARVKVGDGSKK